MHSLPSHPSEPDHNQPQELVDQPTEHHQPTDEEILGVSTSTPFEEVAAKYPLFAFFIENWRTTLLLFLGLVFSGLVSFFSLPRDIAPEVNIPYGIITTVYPGATARDMETLVTQKIEDAIKDVDNLRRYSSSSSFGVSTVSVEFVGGTDMTQAVNDLKDKVDNARGDLPVDAEDPLVLKVENSDAPIIRFSLGGLVSDGELQAIAKDLERQMEAVSGVDKVTIVGERTPEFSVLLPGDRLAQLGLSLGQVASTLSSFHADFPGGQLVLGSNQYEVRLTNKAITVQDIKNLPVQTVAGAVRLGDIAVVEEVLTAPSAMSYVASEHEGEFAAERDIGLQVTKSKGGNVMEITRQLRDVATKFDEENSAIDIAVISDDSVAVTNDFNNLISNFAQSFCIILIVLLFFIGPRESAIAAFMLPSIFLSGFLFISMLGGTVNFMTIFALLLGLNLVVDNILVVAEGYAHFAAAGFSARMSALLTAVRFWGPLLAGTATTVAAFVPMLLVSGILGEYLSILPKTISAVLVVSYFVAVFVMPAMLALVLGNPLTEEELNAKRAARRGWKAVLFNGVLLPLEARRQRMLQGIETSYHSYLTGIITHRPRRMRLYLGSVIALVASIALLPLGLIRVELFGVEDTDTFNINVEYPNGQTLQETDKLVRQDVLPIILELAKTTEVKTVGLAVGSGGSNKADITVALHPTTERSQKSYHITEKYRAALATYGRGDVTLVDMRSGPPSGAAIEINIYGDDFVELDRIANDYAALLEKVPGTTNVRSDFSLSRGEFVFRPRVEALAQYGLTPQAIGQYVRASTYGNEVGEIRVGDDDAKIMLRTATSRTAVTNALDSFQALSGMLVQTPTGQQVPLSALGEFTWQASLTTIPRKDGQRVVRVLGDVEATQTTATAAVTAWEELRKAEQIEGTDAAGTLPAGYSYRVGGETEDIDESFTDLFQSMIIAVILIVVILIVQFNSYRRPLIIASVFMFSLIGVLWGLMLLHIAFSFSAFLGLIALAGVVVNESIVLMAMIRENLAAGEPFADAIIDGGTSRVQSMILTSVPNILGTIPIVVGQEFWYGFGTVLIFGLTAGVFFSLLMVPTLFYSLERRRYAKGKMPK